MMMIIIIIVLIHINQPFIADFELNVDLDHISFTDLQSIRKLLENESNEGGPEEEGSGVCCPSCQMPFDKGKKRKLIDTCGHERCYSCMFKNEQCPVCVSQVTATKNCETGEFELHVN